MFDSIREKLADVQHQIWAHWMKHLFSVATYNESTGTYTIWASEAMRWQRQLNTPYSELSEEEKASDQRQADKILEAFGWNEDEADPTVVPPDYLQKHHDQYVDYWRLGILDEADLPDLYLAIWRETKGIVKRKRF